MIVHQIDLFTPKVGLFALFKEDLCFLYLTLIQQSALK